jgi:hypothetical protein
VIPIPPETGVKDMVGGVIVKVPETLLGVLSPDPLPVTVIVKEPGLTLPTTKDPENDAVNPAIVVVVVVIVAEVSPFIWQNCFVTGVPEIEQVE